MSRTLADKTLRTLAIALACTSASVVELAYGNQSALAGANTDASAVAKTGGASVSLAKSRASASSRSHGALAHKAKSQPHEQIATWFGPGFYGQKTACGQTMTPVIVGIASRTLPCGTLVQIDYKGRLLTVPVIDRGPYAHNGATWDLTWGAASALSIEDTVKVETKIVGHAPNTPLLGAPAEQKPIAGAAIAPAG